MNIYVCSVCGHEQHVFGHGGVTTEVAKLGQSVITEILMHLDIRKTADGGTPHGG